MNISNKIELKEMSEFNVRNVSQKEIYDSYMGILRISPNKIQGKNVDDPTPLLNTLVDFKGIHDGIGINEHVKVTLSDSDGNELPIKFIPKVFTTEVIINEFNGYEKRPIINIATEVQGYSYVSNKLTVRSTLLLSNPIGKKSQLNFILGCSQADNAIECKQILSYPIEAPNDDSFFNNKNKFNLFDYKNTDKSRADQMEENLMNWSREDYANHGLLNSEEHHVKINGEFADTINNHNQYIPILYNKDYVLGTYEGHTVNKRNDNWISDIGTENAVIKDGKQTRLSWVRFDNLIWEALEEILRGEVRHTTGRYNGLGTSGNDDICSTLFGGSYSDVIDDLRKSAPILGQGVQDGIVSYHAMPLKRYWFHRCRQVVSNMEYWQNLVEKSDGRKDWEWYKNGGSSWANYSQASGQNVKFNKKQLEYLQSAFTEGYISPSSDAVVAPQHALSRHFVICDGSEINFINYPNISLKNHNIFSVESKGKKATINEATGFFDVLDIQSRKAVHTFIKSTPELYVFNERYPRFVRALNWKIEGDWDSVTDLKNPNPKSLTDYPDINSSQNTTTAYIHTSTVEEFPHENDGWNDNYSRDAFDNLGIDVPKDINECKLHKYSFEFLTNPIPHTHKMFSAIEGGRGDQDYSKKEIEYTFRAAGQAQHKSDVCLWSNPCNPFSLRTIEWLGYSFDDKKLFFDNYTPVPNAGMLIFNSENFNQFNTIGRLDAQYDLKTINFIQVALTYFCNIICAKKNKILKKKKNDSNFDWGTQAKARLDAFLYSEDYYKPTGWDQKKNRATYHDYTYYEKWYNEKIKTLQNGEEIVKLDPIWWDANIFPDESHSSKSSVTNRSTRYYTNYRTYTFTQYYIDYYRDGDSVLTWQKGLEKATEIIDRAYNEQYPYRGTVPALEQINWKDVYWGYYDNKFEKHLINTNIKINSLSEEAKAIIKNKRAWTSEEQKLVSNELYKHQASKAIRKQVAVKMNEAEAKIPISYYGKAQFSNQSRNIHWWKKKRNWLAIILVGLGLIVAAVIAWYAIPAMCSAAASALAASTQVAASAAGGAASAAASAGGIGSLVGSALSAVAAQLTYVAGGLAFGGSLLGAGFAMGLGWGLTGLLLGATIYGVCAGTYHLAFGKRWIAANGYTGRKNIGSYKFGSFDTSKYNPYEFKDKENSFSWQCLTSLPYTDTENLGCGDITKLKPQNFKYYTNTLPEDGEDYYVFHNVTDRWGLYSKMIKKYDEDGNPYYEKVSFDRNKVSVDLSFCDELLSVQNDAPFPSHLNLIPIIKI